MKHCAGTLCAVASRAKDKRASRRWEGDDDGTSKGRGLHHPVVRCVGPATSAALGYRGNCGTNMHSPGCNVPACQTCVCDRDSFCCNVEWDSNCVVSAAANCSAACVEGFFVGNCGQTAGKHPRPGCSNSGCQGCVCTQDASCCTDSWRNQCVAIGASQCPQTCLSEFFSPPATAPALSYAALAALCVLLGSTGAIQLGSRWPRWTLENRPNVDSSKPAKGRCARPVSV